MLIDLKITDFEKLLSQKVGYNQYTTPTLNINVGAWNQQKKT